jgi:cytochrome P450
MADDTSTLENFGTEYLLDPYAVCRRLREEGPVQHVVLPAGLRVYLVTRYADVRAALADPRLGKDSGKLNELFQVHYTGVRDDEEFTDGSMDGHMLNSDPPDHERLRRLVNKAFTSRRIEQLRPRIEEITRGLLDNIGERSEIDLLDEFAFPLPITVICELLGMSMQGANDFRQWSNLLLSGGEQDEVRNAARLMYQALVELVASKRADPGEDMLSALVQARDADDDKLSERELVSMAFLLLVAGHETTVNLIGNGVLALINNPEQLAELRADRSLLPGAIEEFLRYQGPLNHATLRFTREPVEIGGVPVPEGEFVVVSLASANRDQRRFGDPESLDIHRETSGHLAFGHGIHYCLGAPLARLEAEIAFTGLLDRFGSIELGVPREELRWRPGNLIRGLERLPVRLAQQNGSNRIG